MGLTMLGVGALERGDAQAARTFFEEDLGVLRRLRDKTGTSYGLRGMAGVAALRGMRLVRPGCGGLTRPCGRR